MRRFLFTSAFVCLSAFSSFFILTSSVSASFAPGETLDPGCAPTDGDCIVLQVNASTASGHFGVSTTSPWGLFSINPDGIDGPSFAIGSSTQTDFIIDTNGYVGIGTTTPGSLFSIGSLVNMTTATTTFYSSGGINLASGCFAVGGICISGSGGGSGTVNSGTVGRISYYTGGTAVSSAAALTWDNSNTRLGISTSSPWASLSVGTHNLAITAPSFVVASSSTGVATSTQLILLNGNLGIGTTSPGQKLSVAGDILGNNIIGSYFTGTTTATSTLTGGLRADIFNAASTTASSTFANGLNLTAGCFAINGSCVGGSGGVSLSNANTWTALQTFSANASTTQIGSTGAAYLATVSGNVGIGTTSPWGKFSVNPDALGSGVPEFVVGSSTATHLLVTGGGKVGIGTTAPSSMLDVYNSTGSADIRASATNTSGNTFAIIYALGDGAGRFGAIQWANDGALNTGFFNVPDSFLVRAGSSASGGLILLNQSTTGDIRFVAGGTAASNEYMTIDGPTGSVGIGTTTPGQKLSVAGDILGNNIIGSYFTGTTTATSTLTGGLRADIFNAASTTASSTFANGINLTTGCFAVGGTCISGGGGGGSGTVSSGTINNLAYYTGATTVSSANTLMWDSGNGRLGVGTSTPAASLEVNNTFVFTTEYNNGDSGANKTITWSNGNYQKVTLTEATTLTFASPPGRGQYQLRIVMDGVGGYDITWPATVKWPGGTKPTQTMFAGTSDIIGFFFDGTNYYNNYTMLDVR